MAEKSPSEKVAEVNRLLYMEGQADTAGHVSVRDPENEELAHINPFTTSRGEITPEDVIPITFDNEPVYSADPEPVAEAEIHSAIYRERDDINAVLHTHPPLATLFSITGTNLQACFSRGAIFDRPVPVYDRPDLLTDREEGKALVDAMDGRNEILIKAHGAVVADSDIRRAFTRAIYLERNAYFQYYASLLGNPNVLTPEETERIQEQTWRERSIEKVWNHYVWEAKTNGYLPEEW